MTTAREIVVCAGLDSLYDRAARRFVEAGRIAHAARGRFAVAISGGSTPVPLFTALAEPALRGSVPWESTHVFWVDERCVPPDHEDSNHRLARETFLDAVGLPGDRIHRIQGEDTDPARAAARYEREVRDTLPAATGSVPRFDLVLLGLGADGHTASLFPGSEALAERDRLAVAVRAAETSMPPPVVDRITLTPPAITAGREILFLVVGDGKAPAVAATLEGPRAPDAWPAQMVDRARGTVTWLLDSAAAGRLDMAAEREERPA